MTKLTFFGGVNEIGGNKILLEDKGTKIFLDFGMNFGKHSDFFTEYMPVRKCTSIRDLLELGLLPKMKGIYRKDYCRHMGLDSKEDTSIDGVLVSHGHVDHIGYIHFLLGFALHKGCPHPQMGRCKRTGIQPCMSVRCVIMRR